MRRSIKNLSMATVLALGLCSISLSQLLDEFHPKEGIGGAGSGIYAQRLAEQLQDWASLGRYYADDQRLLAQPVPDNRVVFMGDSITDFWPLAKFFPGKSYVNRGISGQTTPQILVRMYPDVIKLKPAVMILLAGTNDIARNTGPVTLGMIQDNFRAITEIAASHHIKVILCSLLPVSDYGRLKMTLDHPPEDIAKLNQWLKSFAAEKGFGYVDYHSALVDDQGMFGRNFSKDGLHPNKEGYKLMAPLAEKAIEEAIK
ncbi:MAG: SGNH/GDSL hydrolase family protein [Acidobacteriia bacterium]|nr:SGNH/GDSL hydrolase family protein [Terriglobia bacterium]